MSPHVFWTSAIVALMSSALIVSVGSITPPEGVAC
jgi:hypothetical protein